MKGFKSFADTTVLEFEPGVTAVVGPNGSGKSNVVDAVTWVLGAQSTRALRSARMDDVIFMGTTTRAALGRAEVSLTIDNSSGRLPVDGAEVTISRTLFRDGDSEYAINGTTCRLLDVQELLGDSGVGRQQHMIIGQGQLDAILNSSSESRRAVIEEAAGVLKHRRRKERAQRRLDSTQENLERLGDLVREVRRQIRPLERQASSARDFADVESDLRAARHQLYLERLAAHDGRRATLAAQLAGAAARERTLRDEVVTLDAQASAAATDMASRREELLASTLGRLQGLAERARGTSSLIRERRRSLDAALVASADENVIASLEAEAARLDADLASLADVDTALGLERAEVDALLAELGAPADAAPVGETDEADLAALVERVRLLERSLTTLRESERRADARANAARAAREDAIAALSTRRDELDRARETLDVAEAQHVEALRRATDAEVAATLAEGAMVDGLDAGARAQARAEALARALEELSGAGGREIIGGLEGVLGAFLDLIEVADEDAVALEAAAGASVGAMVVDGRRSARAALAALRREGGAGLVLPAAEGPVEARTAPAGSAPIRDLVRARRGAPEHVGRVLDALFARCVVAPDWESGLEIAIANPDLVVVTREGDRFAASGWRVASGRALVTRAAVQEATAAASRAAEGIEALRDGRRAADVATRDARERVANAADARVRASAEVERLTGDVDRLEGVAATAASTIEASTAEASGISAQCAALDAEVSALRAEVPQRESQVVASRDSRALVQARRAEVASAREQAASRAHDLARREAAAGERRRLVATRRAEIEERLAGRSDERDRAAGRRRALEADQAALARLDDVVSRVAADIALSQEAFDASYREQLESSRASAERLEEIRAARRDVDARLEELSDVVRHAEVEQAELAVRVANLHDVIRRDLAVDPDELDDAPPVELAEGTTLEQRIAQLEARLTSLGPINPWALDELAALEERYRDLDAQVGDVRHARRELQEVVRALDDEIMSTFASAYADVNEHFSHLIEMLFPGGVGRLILTDPDDPLNTGVEIEVRPMGRNIRRISLLSGGERSMVTLAFLFAVFRSRPSPFYLMDEVEAALDDVNLQRFLSLVDEFREEAQLLIVTHQKRTMESADALYGVTMAPGGSSQVVSQRVDRPTEVPA